MMEFLKSPNVLQFIGGVVAVLLGALVLKGDSQGPALVMAGVFAMGNAIKSPGDAMAARAEKKRASMAPPAP